jgi:hypothetical protein
MTRESMDRVYSGSMSRMMESHEGPRMSRNVA